MEMTPDTFDSLVTATAVVDLIGALQRLQKQIDEIGVGLSRLSRSLEALHATLSRHRQLIRDDDGKMPLLPLCVCCCRLLATHIEVRLKGFHLGDARLGIWGFIERLRREFWGWRLGRKIARQNQAFLHVLRAGYTDAILPSINEVSDDLKIDFGAKFYGKSSSIGRDIYKTISQIQVDTACLFRRPATGFLPGLLASCLQIRKPTSYSREVFVRGLCDKQFHKPGLSIHLHDYITIKDVKERSRFIDRALLNESQHRRCECHMFTVGGMEDDERALAELDELREPGSRGGSRRRPGSTRIVSFLVGYLQVRIIQPARSTDRRRWIHLFDNIKAFMLVIDMATCIDPLMEDRGVCRLTESIVLFDSIVNSRFYKDTSVVLVFDNVDVFARKLQSDPLERFFPEYRGGADLKQAAGFILEELAKKNRSGNMVHPVFALSESSSFTAPFCSAVEETMLHQALKNRGAVPGQ